MRRRLGSHRYFYLLLAIGLTTFLISYAIAGTRQKGPTLDQRISRAYGHDVGHCEINKTLTRAIRKAGGGQTAYRCGDANYSAIINAQGVIFPGGNTGLPR